METIKLTIDNRTAEVAPGTNLVEAAASVGIKIPTLCYLNLHELGCKNDPGVCRICVVEVEGRKNLAPACKTVCTEGMVVRTHTPRVINARQTILELILSDIEVLDRRIDKTRKMLKADKKYQAELDFLERVHQALEEGKSARSVECTEEEAELLEIDRRFPLLMLEDVNKSPAGRIFEYSKVLFRGDKIKLHFEYETK